MSGTDEALDRFEAAVSGPDTMAPAASTGAAPELPLSFHALVPVPARELAAPDQGYDYRLTRWGTKWELTREQTRVDRQSMLLCFDFDTASLPPLPWVRTAARRFLDLKFSLIYFEPNDRYTGYAYLQGAMSEEFHTRHADELRELLESYFPGLVD